MSARRRNTWKITSRRNLVPGESVVYAAKEHWISLFTWRAILSLWILWIVDRLTNEYAITSKRVLIKVGLISRRTIEMSVAKIESVGVDQSILGRVLGFGTITIVGTGGTREAFHRISSPLQFRKSFQQLQA